MRRVLLKSLGIGTVIPILQTTESQAGPRTKVAYHLSDYDRVSFVLGNIANHVNAARGSGSPSLILVVHGPALPAFVARSIDDRIAERTAQLLEAGVGFEACDNTLKGAALTLLDLVPGFTLAKQGGVVRLAELQTEGYAYIRP